MPTIAGHLLPPNQMSSRKQIKYTIDKLLKEKN